MSPFNQLYSIILGARFGKRRLQQMDNSQLENFENCIGDHSRRLCTPRGEHSISVASDITHSARYSTLRKWDTDNKKLKSLTNCDDIRQYTPNYENDSSNKTTTSSIPSSSKSTPSITLRGGFAVFPSPNHVESRRITSRCCKNVNGSKVIL